MSQIFYDHLILVDEIVAELDVHKMDPEERQELLDLIDQTLHHHTLNVILNHLPKEHHQTFLDRFYQKPHDAELLKFLKDNIAVDIEKEIKTQADRVKKDILAEIKKSKTAK